MHGSKWRREEPEASRLVRAAPAPPADPPSNRVHPGGVLASSLTSGQGGGDGGGSG